MRPVSEWLKKLSPFLNKKRRQDIVDESSKESFPASDPPAWAGSKAESADRFEPDTNVISLLIKEHEAIMRAVYDIHGIIEQLQAQKPIDTNELKTIIEFLHDFVDLNHHRKEEQFLFPALQHNGAPLTDCPLAGFLEDHKLGQRWIEALKKATAAYERKDKDANSQLIEALSQLKEIYVRHTLKEENFIFPVAEKYLSKRDQKNLLVEFEKIDEAAKM